MTRPPVPPFTAETAAQKARLAEDAWNTRDPKRGRGRLYDRLVVAEPRRIVSGVLAPWTCPGLVDGCGFGFTVSGLTAFCPPFLDHLLVRPRASFRPGLHVLEAVVSSGSQGRPSCRRCKVHRRLEAAP